jgi:Spy/CpxP family protein refolding chaperone
VKAVDVPFRVWTNEQQSVKEQKANRDWRKTMKGIKGIVVFWVLIYILVGWVGVYAIDAAPDCPMKGFGKHGGMFKQILTRLDLSDSQEHDIAIVLKQHREQMQGLRTQMIEARKAQFAAVTTSPFDEEAVRKAASKAADLEVQLSVHRAQLFDEIRQHLTPEQQTKLQQIASKFAARMQERIEHKASMLDRWIDENSNL